MNAQTLPPTDLTPDEEAHARAAADMTLATPAGLAIPRWEDGLVEEARPTAYETVLLICRRVHGENGARGGLIFAYVPVRDPLSGEAFTEYRSFPYERDLRRPTYGRTTSGQIMQVGTMYKAGRRDAGMHRGKRWSR